MASASFVSHMIPKQGKNSLSSRYLAGLKKTIDYDL